MVKQSCSPMTTMSLIFFIWNMVTLLLAHQSAAEDKTLTQNRIDFVGASHTNATTNAGPTLWNHILAVSYGYGMQSAFPTKFRKPMPPNHTNFTIHGLWPNNNPHPSPRRLQKPQGTLQSCSTLSLLPADVGSLRSNLLVNWPNVYDYANPIAALRFWDYEWRKHGTCTPLSKLQYFQKSMDLFNLLGLTSIIKTGAALAPNDTKSYIVRDLLQAFPGKQPFLVCAKRHGGYVLTELYFCLDNQARAFVNCLTFYTATNNNCQSGFKILTK